MKNLRLTTKLRRWAFIGLLWAGFTSHALSQSVKVEGESFLSFCCGDGKVEKENGNTSVGYFDNENEKLTYSINVTTAGYYTFSAKYLAGKSGSIIVRNYQNADAVVDFSEVVNPGGNWWEIPIANWPTVTNNILIYLKAGTQDLFIINKSGAGFNIDYMTFTYSNNQSVNINSITITPSPISVKPFHKIKLSAQAYSGTDKVAVPFNWSVNVVNGVYTAGNLGTDQVSATYNSVSKTETVTIQMPQKKQNFVVNHHGRLNIKTGEAGLYDKNGQKASFAGPSFFWSCSAPKYYNKDFVKNFVAQYKAGIIRLAMSVAPGKYNGFHVDQGDAAIWNKDNYYFNPEKTLEMIETVIDAAIENDIYVIVDFHEHHAERFVNQAKTFFESIAKTYGQCDNVIFEIYNEPLGNSSESSITPWSTIKDYANQVIPVIRQYSNNIIVVGTPSWSQDIQDVDNSLTSYGNIAYTLHYYANQHGNSLVSKMDLGKPVIITECGNDGSAMWDYINKAKEKGVSMMSWSVNNAGYKPNNDNSKWSIFTDENQNFTGPWTSSDLRNPAGTDQTGIISGWPRAVEPVTICEDNVLNRIELTPKDVTIGLNVTQSFAVKGYSSCKEVAIPGSVTWTGAPNGQFVSATKGTFKVKACAGNFCDSTTVTVTDVVNMLTNGDFNTASISPWTTYINAPASATFTTSNKELSVTIPNAGSDFWHVQVYQGNMKVEQGKTYTLSFRAKAANGRKITALVEKNGSPYTNYCSQANDNITLTSTMTQYSYSFVMNSATDANSRVTFNLGKNAGDVVIDDVILSAGGSVNQKPIANAGADQTLNSGTTSYTLDGSLSSDPDGQPSPLNYTWSQVNGPTVSFSSTSIAKPVITGLTDGNSYTFQLIVNDGADNSSADQVVISVNNPAGNMLTNGDFNTGAISPWTTYINAPAVANFDPSSKQLAVTISNAGNEVWHAQIYQGNLKVEQGKTYTLSFNAYASVSRKITALVEKNGSPYTNYTGKPNDNISLTTEKTKYSYDFTMINTTDQNARVTFNLGKNAGNVFIDDVDLRIKTVNTPPIANAGPDQNLNANEITTTLDGSLSSDPDQGPSALTYAWTQIAGDPVTLSSATIAKPGVSGLAKGKSYSFRLVVYDGKDSNADTVKVSVSAVVMYSLTTSTIGTGSGTISLSPAGGSYAENTVVTLTANTASDSKFVGWSGDASGTSSSVNVTMTKNMTVTAQFDRNSTSPYPFGIVPTNATTAEARAAYDAFMTNFYEECDGSKARIKWGMPGRGDSEGAQTVSEGIAYGMILTAYFKEQTKFDKLWNYYKANLDANGLMNWKINGCGGVAAANAATDAEVDAAFALVVAHKINNWTQYENDARSLISKIKQYEVEAGTNVLKPGDMFGGSSLTNISYFSTGYFRVFGKYTNDENFWNSVASKSYEIIANNLRVNNAVDGIVSDWCKADGYYGDSRTTYLYDACRTPWRIATDYVWYGTADAKTYLEKSNNFITRQGGIANIVDGYKQDGTKVGQWNNTTFVSTFACAGMVLSSSSNSVLDSYYTHQLSKGPWSYFDYCFDALTKLLFSGGFQNPYNGTVNYSLNVNVVGSGSVTLNPAGGTYASGTVVTITASNGTFQGWSGDLTGSANPTTITMNGNKSVTATFTGGTTYTLTTSKLGTGTGTITLSPDGGVYAAGTTVTVTATATGNSTFGGWSGDASGTSTSVVITMSSNKSVAATFNPGSSCTVWQSGVNYPIGTVVTYNGNNYTSNNNWNGTAPDPYTATHSITGWGWNIGGTCPALKSALIATDATETGIENGVYLFPNPVASHLKVVNNLEGQSTFVLYDMSGKTLVLKNISSGVSQFDVSDLRAGVYFVKLVNGATTINQKIVKR